MKRFSGLRAGTLALATLLPMGAVAGRAALAQAPASATTGTVHGHVNNAIGQPIVKGDVRLSTDKSANNDRKYAYTFPLNGTGDFKGDGVAPGDYLAVVIVDGKSVDFLPALLRAGGDLPLNFDMTRADYIAKLTPEERKALEETKAKNAGATAYNAKVADLNKTMLQARADAAAGRTAEAVQSMQAATQTKPDEALLWATLGEVQLVDAKAATKAARAAHTSTMDAGIVAKYQASADSYQKALDLNKAAPKPNVELASKAELNLGEDLANTGKTQEASEAFESAVKADPASASTAYFNEAAIFFNASKLDEAAAAADKAIAADPKRAEAYYIKGQALIPKATVDPKTQKIVAPPGCVEAYQEYLELAPDGPHAADVKELLTNLGEPIKNSYKASKKK